MTIKLYVGITCIPGREEYLEKTLTSFTQQKVLPQKVFVSYCKNYTRFPEKNFNKSIIEKFKNDELFEFIESDIDYGPATKFIIPIKKLLDIEKDNLNNTFVIVCDDDRTYYDYFLQVFNNLIKNNDKVVYTGYSEILDKNKNFKLAFGADGYNIKGTWFQKLLNWYDQILSVENFGKEVWFHDDYTTSSFFHYNNIQIHNTGKRSCPHHFYDDISLTARMKKLKDDRGSKRNSKCGMAYNAVRSKINNKIIEVTDYVI